MMRLFMLLAFLIPSGVAYMLPVVLMRRYMEVRPDLSPSSHTVAEEVPAVEEVALDLCPPREPLWIVSPQCNPEDMSLSDHPDEPKPEVRFHIFDCLDQTVVCAILLVMVSLATWTLRRRTGAAELPSSDIEETGYTEFYRERETRIHVNSQSGINEEMRAFLVNWAIDVHLCLQLAQETLYLTVNIINKYLESEQATPQDLLLVGVTAILLASKYEEANPPKIHVLAISTNCRYTKQDIIKMESKMARAIQYRLTVPTIYSFLLCYHKAEYGDDKIAQLSCFVAERMLQEVSMLDYLPSVIACSAIYIARMNTGRTCWSPTLEEHTKYHEEDLIPCLTEMSRILKAEGDLDAVKKKFSSSKFGSVATMEIAVLPDDLP